MLRSSKTMYFVVGLVDSGVRGWVLPKVLVATSPRDTLEERRIRKLGGARYAPGDWIRRARMITSSWDGKSTAEIAQELGLSSADGARTPAAVQHSRPGGVGRPARIGAQTSPDRDRAQSYRGLGRHNATRAVDAAIRWHSGSRAGRGAVELDAGFADRGPARRRHCRGS